MVAVIMLLTMVSAVSFQTAEADGAAAGNALMVMNGDDDGPGTLRAALEAAKDGDTIIFGGVTAVSLSEEISFDKKNITINGVAGVTIARVTGDDFRLLNSTAAEGVLTLKGLTLRNGSAADGGGVYAGGDVSLINCIIAGNESAGSGGGLYAGGNVSSAGCTFINNAANGDGGGLYAGGSIVLTDCTFTGNIAVGDGGGLYACGDAALKNCGIAYGASAGGMVYSASGSVDADNSSFFANEILGNTAGILSAYSGMGLRHCTFTFNNSTGTEAYNIYVRNGSMPAVANCLMTKDGLTGNGHPVFTGDNMLGVDYTGNYKAWFGKNILTFNYIMPLPGAVGNTAAVIPDLDRDAGGELRTAAKCLYGAANLTAWSLMAVNNYNDGAGSLRGCLAEAVLFTAPDRSVVYFDPAISPFHIQLSSVISVPNNAIIYGRLGSNGMPDVTVDGSGVCRVFSGVSNSNTFYYGLNIENGSFSAVFGSGGGIGSAGSGSTFVITSCVFKNNKTLGNLSGGAVGVFGTGDITITNSIFEGNSTLGSGGAVSGGNGNTVVTGCVFFNNNAKLDGGALSAQSPPLLDHVTAITDCVFIGNSTAGNSWGGGGVFMGCPVSTLTGCVFVDNVSGGILPGESGGGGVFAYYSDVVLTDCIFLCNTAPNRNGGGVLAYSDATLTGCVFISNNAYSPNPKDGLGGGVYVLKNAVLDSCVFADNEAANGAGAIHAESLYITNCTIAGNITGGIESCAVESTGESHVFHTTVTNNTGGGICAVNNGRPVYLYNSIISGNTAADSTTPLQTKGDVVNVSSLIDGQDGVVHELIFGQNVFDPSTGVHEVHGDGIAAGTAGAITATDLSALAAGLQQAVLTALKKDQVGAPRSSVSGGKVTFGAAEAFGAADDEEQETVVGGSSSSYYITAKADTGSLISPSGTVTVPHGQNKTFAFFVKEGYQISAVYVDEVAIQPAGSASGEYTFYNVKSNHTISVVSKASGESGGSDGDSGAIIDGSGGSEWAVLNLICAILAAFTGAIAVIARRDRFRRDDEEKRSRAALLIRFLALMIGIFSVVIFFLTEDWRLPATAMDEWTLLMFILFLATFILIAFSFRFDEDPEDEAEGPGMRGKGGS